jgi:hypothetical protein
VSGQWRQILRFTTGFQTQILKSLFKSCLPTKPSSKSSSKKKSTQSHTPSPEISAKSAQSTSGGDVELEIIDIYIDVTLARSRHEIHRASLEEATKRESGNDEKDKVMSLGRESVIGRRFKMLDKDAWKGNRGTI